MRSSHLMVLLASAAAGLGGCGDGGLDFDTAPTPDTHTYFPIQSGVHAQACDTCHGSYSTFTEYTCANCHAGSAAAGAHGSTVMDRIHLTTPMYPALGAMGTPATGDTCAQCHRPPTIHVDFDHLKTSTGGVIKSDCAMCHGSGAEFQRLPLDAQNPSPGKTCPQVAPMHPDIGASDCSGCHADTTDWCNAQGGVDKFDPARDVTVMALAPTYQATSIVQVTPLSETLHMPMSHLSSSVPKKAGGVALACSDCHAQAASASYYPGVFHASVAALQLPQPTTCNDCHATSAPTGFVGPTAQNPMRQPPSGEMKHDAVAWLNDAPTTSAIVAADCSACHVAPSTQGSATWASPTAGGTVPRYHASLIAAAQAQPTSCIDCHANTRPSGMVTSATGVTFDHTLPASLGECAACHTNGAPSVWTTSWAGGSFHTVNQATPTTCLPCHQGERPTSTATWQSPSYQASPFDYVPNTDGVSHGDGQDCVTCHDGPGTGAWGSTQNWQGGHFSHDARSTVAGYTCMACHATQRPTMPVTYGSSTFDHSLSGTGDCFGCHQATVTAGRYVTWPDDWSGAVGYPGSTLIGSRTQFITISEITLQRSGTSNLVTGMTTSQTTLYNQMLHVSTAVPAQLNPGPTSNPDCTKCALCHTATGCSVDSSVGGRFHDTLAAMGLAEPTSQCSDCHGPMRPVGIVEGGASELQPMDHAATFTTGVSLGGATVQSLASVDCSACHLAPTSTTTVTPAIWDRLQQPFHQTLPSTTTASAISDCTTCHYPLEADGAASNLTRSNLWSMKHASPTLAIQNCRLCHTDAFAAATMTPPLSTRWQGALLHAHVPSQPALCLDCHAVSLPPASPPTASSVVYALALGATSSNGPQYMSHVAPGVAGKDCGGCHAGDAVADGTTSGAPWSKSTALHANLSTPATCQGCHGVANGGGTTLGTNNNLPLGLTDSTTQTTASQNSATGVVAGTLDQIDHSDVNVTSHDCNFCHTQVGPGAASGVQGKEWAQASFHAGISAGGALVINSTTGRCSHCHLNVKPTASFAAQDHSTFSSTGTKDCGDSGCHGFPGTGTVKAPNWIAVPADISVGNFPIPNPPASTPTTQPGIPGLPHPTVGSTPCSACHGASTSAPAIGYDHASSLAAGNCGACHEAGSPWVGTTWNNATSESAGAGDTRPITLPSVVAQKGGIGGDSCTVTETNHFYPIDCNECHAIPSGDGATTTGSAYQDAWRFPHLECNRTGATTGCMHGDAGDRGSSGTCASCHPPCGT